MPAFYVWFLPFLTCQSSLCDAYALFTIWLFLQSFHFLYTARSCFFFLFFLSSSMFSSPPNCFRLPTVEAALFPFVSSFQWQSMQTSIIDCWHFPFWTSTWRLLEYSSLLKEQLFGSFHPAICQMLCKEQLLTFSSLVMLFGLCAVTGVLRIELTENTIPGLSIRFCYCSLNCGPFSANARN